MALHELVTKFQRGQYRCFVGLTSAYSGAPTGSLSSTESGPLSAGLRPKPEVVFATSSGTIGIIADIGPQDSQLLSELQLNMDGVIKGPSVDWRK